MQTPSSEEMHSHSHFPTCGASEKGIEMRRGTEQPQRAPVGETGG